MGYMKRTIQHPRVARISDKNGDVLCPIKPAPLYRVSDRPRRLPEGHPMAIHIEPPPLRGELTARVCAAAAWIGMAFVVLGVFSAVGWL